MKILHLILIIWFFFTSRIFFHPTEAHELYLKQILIKSGGPYIVLIWIKLNKNRRTVQWTKLFLIIQIGNTKKKNRNQNHRMVPIWKLENWQIEKVMKKRKQCKHGTGPRGGRGPSLCAPGQRPPSGLLPPHPPPSPPRGPITVGQSCPWCGARSVSTL